MTSPPEQKVTVRLTRPIVLVGLMGAGKTSIGKRLAAFLDVPFHDSDHEIETAAGMTIAEIFARYGEPHFRDGERKVIRRLLTAEPGILATGGGAFVSAELREDIARNGLSVWLNADLDTLWDRVKDRDTRPLLKQANPRQVLSDLLEARREHYAKAAITVPSEAGVAHDVMVRRILEAVRAWDLAHPEQRPTLERRMAA